MSTHNNRNCYQAVSAIQTVDSSLRSGWGAALALRTRSGTARVNWPYSHVSRPYVHTYIRLYVVARLRNGYDAPGPTTETKSLINSFNVVYMLVT